MSFSRFSRTCGSAFRRQSLCLYVSKRMPESLRHCSTFNAAQTKLVITKTSSASMRLPLSSSVRQLLGRGCLCDAATASPAGTLGIHTSGALLADKVNITFKTEKETVTLSGAVGDSLLDIVNNNNYEIDGFGACDGTVACSTCHCVLEQETYNVLNKGVTEEEQDLLDMASGRQATTGLSLAGCGFLAPYVLGAVTCLRETDYWLPLASTAPPLRVAASSAAKEGLGRPSASHNGVRPRPIISDGVMSRDLLMKNNTSASENTFLQAALQQDAGQAGESNCVGSRLGGHSSATSSTNAKTVESPCFSKSYSEMQYTLQSCNLEHEPPPAGGVGGGGCPTKVAGASAGALLGAAFLAGSPSLEDLWYTFLSAANDSAHFVLGPFSRKFVMERYIRGAMEALPANAHELLSGKLIVSVTDVKTMKNVLVSEWDSREDLIDCLLCSCYIPMFSGGSVPLFRGRPCIDGGFSNNQPKPFTSCLSISPFAGRAHICPKQTTSKSMFIHVSNADLLLSKENFVRFYRTILPYKTKDLYRLYWQGFKDAEHFLLNERNIQSK